MTAKKYATINVYKNVVMGKEVEAKRKKEKPCEP